MEEQINNKKKFKIDFTHSENNNMEGITLSSEFDKINSNIKNTIEKAKKKMEQKNNIKNDSKIDFNFENNNMENENNIEEIIVDKKMLEMKELYEKEYNKRFTIEEDLPLDINWKKYLWENFYKLPLIYNNKNPDKINKAFIAQEYKLQKQGFWFSAFTGLEFKRPRTDKRPTTHLEVLNEYKPYSIVCGEKNNISIIDLDINKKIWEEMGNGHPFIVYFTQIKKICDIDENWRTTLNSIINIINTYTNQTKGGFHLYFENKNCDTTLSGQVPKLEIDLQSNGQLIIGAGSKFYLDGELREYKNIINTRPLDFENYRECWEYLYSHTNDKKAKETNKVQKLQREAKNRPVDQNQYKYDINDEDLKLIEDRIPDYLFSMEDLNYLKVTGFYKIINRKEEWDKISKEYDGYNKEKNEEMWNSADTSLPLVEWLISKCNDSGTLINKMPEWKYKPIRDNIIEPNNKIDAWRISEEINLQENKNYVIQSPMKTGKSYLINQYHNENRNIKIISIVSRVSLAQEHLRVFDEYNEKKDLPENNYILYNLKQYQGSLRNYEGENIIICIDSLDRLNFDDYSNYTIILDEFNSIFEYLFRSTTLKNKRQHIRFLMKKILNECKQFICLDADITDTALLYLDARLFLKHNLQIDKDIIDESPCEEFEYIQNIKKPYSGTKMQEIFSYEKLANMLKHKKKFMVCSDSMSEAKKLKIKIEKLCGRKRNDIVVICRDYHGEMNLDEHNCVIFSPKIVYGLDSLMKREVFCLFMGQTITAKAMAQQVGRCRNIEKLWFYFPNKQSDLETPFDFNNEEEVYSRITLLNNWGQKKFIEYSHLLEEHLNHTEWRGGNYDYIGKMKILENNFYSLLLRRILYDEDCDRSNKYYHFKNGLVNKGFIKEGITRVTLPRNRKEQKELKMEMKEEIKEEFMENWEHEDYQRTNQTLYMDEEQIKKYYLLFTDPLKYTEHFGYTYLYFIDNIKKLEGKYKSQYKKDYGFNIEQETISKVLFVKNMLKDIEVEENTLYGSKQLTDDKIAKYKEQFKILFKSTRKVEWKDNYDIGKLINFVMKKIGGSTPYISIEEKLPPLIAGGARRNITHFKLNKEDEGYKYHKKIYDIRVEARKKQKEKNNILNCSLIMSDDDL